MLQSAIPKRSILLLTAIAALAVILSIISYQYSSSTSDEIVNIASQEVRSNARIVVHDLSQILTNRLLTTTVFLQTLADGPSLQNNEYERAQLIINDRQNHTSGLTDFYMWLNQNGKIVWISNINATTYQKYKGFDLSYRPYFTVPRDSHTPYYSSLIESNDNVPRLYISYPVLSKPVSELNNATNKVNNETNSNNFKGIVVAAINGTTTANILQSQLLPHFNGTVSLLDNNGIILHASNGSIIGKNFFGTEFQSIISALLPHSSKNLLNKLVNASLHQSNNSGMQDIYMQGETHTIAYEPVTLQGKHFLTLYVNAPHNLSEQRSYSNRTTKESEHDYYNCNKYSCVWCCISWF